MASIKKTKTIGSKSESFMREIDNSNFILDEERQEDLKFIKTQPDRGRKILQYFIRTGLKYKEVFDAINIGDLNIDVQMAHLRAIAALLKEHGWQGKVDLHTRPVGAFDHPSPHFHLWGSQVTKEVYALVKNYLLENNLTDETRLKQMKTEKFIQKLSREDVKREVQKPSDEKSAGPAEAELEVRRRKTDAGKRLEGFVDRFKNAKPEAVAAVERVSDKKALLSQKIDALKKSISGKEDELVVKPAESRQKAVGSKFEDSAKALKARLQSLKTNLSTNK
jgi:hypothetical protein